jgi:hypothetical protein
MFSSQKYHIVYEHNILPPSQNINKNGSTKVNVFGLNFALNTLIFVDHFLLIFWDGGSSLYMFNIIYRCNIDTS